MIIGKLNNLIEQSSNCKNDEPDSEYDHIVLTSLLIKKINYAFKHSFDSVTYRRAENYS